MEYTIEAGLLLELLFRPLEKDMTFLSGDLGAVPSVRKGIDFSLFHKSHSDAEPYTARHRIFPASDIVGGPRSRTSV